MEALRGGGDGEAHMLLSSFLRTLQVTSSRIVVGHLIASFTYSERQTSCCAPLIISFQAHATAHRVTLLYLCKNAGAAAYLKDWDSRREAGVRLCDIVVFEIMLGGRVWKGGVNYLS